MTQIAKEEYYVPAEGAPGGISVAAAPLAPTPMPINPVERERRAREGSRDLSARASVAFHDTKQSAGRLYLRARSFTAGSYTRVWAKTQDLSRQSRSVVRYVRHEHPVELLGAVAGAAFLTGVALRIWRSQS